MGAALGFRPAPAAGDVNTALDSQSITTATELSVLLEEHEVRDSVAIHRTDGCITDHHATGEWPLPDRLSPPRAGRRGAPR